MSDRSAIFDAARLRMMLLAGAWVIAAAPLAAQGDKASVVEIALSSFKFSPETIRLEHGRPYVLHLTNRSGGGHDFTARAFFDAATIAPEDHGRIEHGSIELGGHEEANIHLIAPPAGRYKVHCAHFMHTMFGMKGEILVE